jgi:hypothetical protein
LPPDPIHVGQRSLANGGILPDADKTVTNGLEDSFYIHEQPPHQDLIAFFLLFNSLFELTNIVFRLAVKTACS